MRWIFDEYLGGKDPTPLPQNWKQQGFPTIRGAKEWQDSVVKGILRNCAYEGICCFRKPIRPMESHSFAKTTEENCPSI